jgi:hypothetical protein
MKSSLTVFAAVALLVAAACSASVRGSTGPAALSSAPAKQPPSVMYGHIKSLTRVGRRFEMRFDPAWWLTGLAAQRAALEDTGSGDVPNDYYIVEEGHRLLTFAVLPSAQVTVLTGGGIHRTQISVSELAQIVKGKNPKHRRLSEPKAGFWIRIGEKYPNPAVTLYQQYQP